MNHSDEIYTEDHVIPHLIRVFAFTVHKIRFVLQCRVLNMSRFSAALFFNESFRVTFDLGLVLASLFVFDRESDLLVPRMAFVILCSVDSFSFSRLPFAEEQD